MTELATGKRTPVLFCCFSSSLLVSFISRIVSAWCFFSGLSLIFLNFSLLVSSRISSLLLFLSLLSSSHLNNCFAYFFFLTIHFLVLSHHSSFSLLFSSSLISIPPLFFSSLLFSSLLFSSLLFAFYFFSSCFISVGLSLTFFFANVFSKLL